MGRVDIDGVKYETKGAMQGAQIAQAINKLSEYKRKKMLEHYKPKIQFKRQNLNYYHLKPFDMQNFYLQKLAPKNYTYYICAFTIGCIVFTKTSRLIYDQDVRYVNLVTYPKQMKFFDNTVEAISSKFWQIGRDYFGDFIIPSIRTEQEFYNFTYSIKNKIFKIEERKAKSEKEFTNLKANAIQSDQDIKSFDDVVSQQDKEMKKLIWQLEDDQKLKLTQQQQQEQQQQKQQK